jgi:hypothetical protein
MPMRSSTLRSNLKLIGCFLAGALCILACMPFAYILFSRANTFAPDQAAIEFKLHALYSAGKRRIVIVSGSNGWYSIDSELMLKAMRRPVINASVHFGLATYVMERVASEVGDGDFVLMPLEYEHYLQPPGMGRTESCFLVFNKERPLPLSFAWYAALSSCPAKAQNIASAVGDWWRNRPQSIHAAHAISVMTKEGDRADNEQQAATWRGGWKLNVSTAIERIDQPRIEAAIAKMKARGATVAITFPVQPKESVGGPNVLPRWRELVSEWASRQNIPMISIPEDHLFPDSCFLDTPYHLHRGCTSQNTEKYISAMREHLAS